MRRRAFLHIACILLLLFAQQVAYSHAAWHAAAHGSASHEGTHDGKPQERLCALHGAFAQVLGSIHAACPLALLEPGAFNPLAVLPPQPRYVSLHLPPVRGPPSRS